MATHKLSILVEAIGAAKASKDLKGVDSAVGNIGATAGRGIRTAGRNIAAGMAIAGAGIAAAVHSGLRDLATLENATTSVDGAIKAVGISGKVTAGQVAGWANDIEASVGAAFDDKDIVSATATLIRYGRVVPSNLRPAMQVMTDLAARTGSVDSASKLLAKALADPTKAAGALRKAGVVLTKQQEEQIKKLVKAGKVEQAQAIILKDLEKSTKGAAAATQGPYQRALSVLSDVSEDARKALAEGFLPVIEKVADLLSKELAKPSTIQGLRDFGKTLASGLDSAVEIAKSLPWGTIGQSLKIGGEGARAILDAFTKLPPWVQTAVLTGWGLNKLTGGALGGIVGELSKGLIKGVLGMTAGVVNINAGVVNGAGGGGVPGAAAGAAGKGAGIVEKAGAATVAAGGALLIQEAHNFGADAGKAFLQGVLPGMPKAGEDFARVFGAHASMSVPGLDALQHLDQIPGQIQQFADFVGGKVDINGQATRTTIQQSGAATAAAAAAQLANTRAVITAGDTRTEGALSRLNATTRGGYTGVAHAVDTAKATIHAGDSRSEAALSRLNATTRGGYTGVKSSVNAVASKVSGTTAAIRNKRWQFTVNNTIPLTVTVSARDSFRATRHQGSTQTIR